MFYLCGGMNTFHILNKSKILKFSSKMSGVNKKFVKFMGRISAMLLALLGFAACDEYSGKDTPVMYGTPNGTYEVKGKVTTEDGAPVEDAIITVSGAAHYNPNDVFMAESDANGGYSVSGYGDPKKRKKVVCRPADDDLEPDSTIIELEYIDDGKGSDSWYAGHADATVNFKLKSKKPLE